MDFTLKINMDSAAFDVMPERELTSLLSKVAADISDGKVEGKIVNINGNTVGHFVINE